MTKRAIKFKINGSPKEVEQGIWEVSLVPENNRLLSRWLYFIRNWIVNKLKK